MSCGWTIYSFINLFIHSVHTCGEAVGRPCVLKGEGQIAVIYGGVMTESCKKQKSDDFMGGYRTRDGFTKEVRFELGLWTV